MPCKSPPEKNSASRWDRARRAAAVCLWAGFIVLCIAERDKLTVDNILNYTPEQPLLAALVLLILFAVKSLSVVLYGGILFAAGGRMFPLPMALLVNSLGSAVMLTLPFLAGRRMGRGAVEGLLEKEPRLRGLQSRAAGKERALLVFIRLAGMLPGDLVSMFFGASGVSYGRYILWSTLGTLPSVVMFTVMGEHLHEPGSPAFLLAAGGRIAILFLSVYISFGRRDAHAP